MSAQNHVNLLGKTAKDKVTGFQGTITSVSFDLFGCIQAAISPPVDKDAKYTDGRWFDVNRLEIVNESHVMPVPAFGKVEFGKTPATHTHGPADKPAGGIK